MSEVLASPSSVVAARPCQACSREWGAGVACQFCGQVEGLPVGVHLSSPARRFGGYLLEGLVVVGTLGIGWLVWSFTVYGRGQTPAKQILGMRVVALRQGRAANWGQMFLREWIAKPVIGLLSWLTLGIAYFWLIWDGRNQELWDKVVGTIVVNDPDKQLVCEGRAPTPELRPAPPASGPDGPKRDWL